jgi:hypothetical protein
MTMPATKPGPDIISPRPVVGDAEKKSGRLL